MFIFFFNDTATTEIYTLSLHDALPILAAAPHRPSAFVPADPTVEGWAATDRGRSPAWPGLACPTRSRAAPRRGFGRTDLLRRSEEHTSELQSRQYLVCRLLLEKKNSIS